MTQKEAVFQAMVNVCGKYDGAYTPTKDQRSSVNVILLQGFRSGEIGYDGDFNSLSESDQKAYVSGLQSNWLRKDKRLNGNVQYVAKNPGSRAGSGDAMIKASRILLQTQEDPEKRAQIQEFIDKRLAQIRPARGRATLTEEQVEMLRANGLEHLLPESVDEVDNVDEA